MCRRNMSILYDEIWTVYIEVGKSSINVTSQKIEKHGRTCLADQQFFTPYAFDTFLMAPV